MEKVQSVFAESDTERKISVLIVDDSDYIRERLLELFRDAGFQGNILQAGNSDLALEILSSGKPDIVVLDIRIPGDNGIKTLEIMKKMNPGVPVVMLTNYPYDQYREKCLSLGADSFLSKSDDFEKIPGICHELVNKIYKA